MFGNSFASNTLPTKAGFFFNKELEILGLNTADTQKQCTLHPCNYNKSSFILFNLPMKYGY